jgi:hypothetical protein
MQDVHRALAQAQLHRLLTTWLALEGVIAQAQDRLSATRSPEGAALLVQLLADCADDMRRVSEAPPRTCGRVT